MCGISGFIDFKSQSTERILEDMSTALYHRGPDASGSKYFQLGDVQIGLAHRRLSIIDLSLRKQNITRITFTYLSFCGNPL